MTMFTANRKRAVSMNWLRQQLLVWLADRSIIETASDVAGNSTSGGSSARHIVFTALENFRDMEYEFTRQVGSGGSDAVARGLWKSSW